MPNSEPVYKHFRGKWKELESEGSLPSQSNEPETKLKNLDNKSIIELEEFNITSRKKFLKNKAFISKLNDRGEKIKTKFNDLCNTLKRVKEKSKVKNRDSDRPLSNIDDIEWGISSGKETPRNNVKDKLNELNYENEDEDNSNPLELLARHSIEYPSSAVHRHEDGDDSAKLIEEELEKLKLQDSESSSSPDDDSNAITENLNENYFGNRVLKLFNEKHNRIQKKEPFRPYRSLTINNDEGTLKHRTSTNAAKEIPLEESLILIAEANKTQSFIRSHSGTPPILESRVDDPISDLPLSNYHNYRDKNAPQHILDEYEEDINEFIYSTKLADQQDLED